MSNLDIILTAIIAVASLPLLLVALSSMGR